MAFSVLMKLAFAITGTPNVLIDSFNLLCPPPVAISPQTAARLHSHWEHPRGPLNLLEDSSTIDWLHFSDCQLMIDARPCLFHL